MMKSNIRFSKLKMYKILLKNEVVKDTLPVTDELTESNFWTFIDKYKEVIIKRDNIGKGTGILKVKILDEEKFEARIEDEQTVFDNKKELYSFINEKTNGSPFVIQQHVALAKIDESPFDIRVIVQRKIGSKKWEITGRYAKVAKKGFFKTNLAAGGNVLPVEQAIKLSTIEDSVDITELISQIDNISLEATKQAGTTKKFKNWLIWGMDIGIENNGKLFLFEANEVPGIRGFRRLPDQSMRNKIRSIKAHNRKLRQKN